MIQSRLVLIVLVVSGLLLCICLIPVTNSQGATENPKNLEHEKTSSTPLTFSSGQIAELPTDRFGVEMLYHTKIGGQEWYMNMVNPASDNRFNPQDHITKNSDGSWKIKSNKVRMYVYTSEGYNHEQITSNSGQSRLASRGFMNSPQDWKDVEITGYVKLNEFSENDNFVWFTRGGRHTDSDQCQGSGYKGNLFYLGETQFSKEQWHVSYAKSPTTSATGPLQGKWIGFKFVMYNFVRQDNKPAVKLENWIDPDANGKNWMKVYEGADAGKWGRTGMECQVRADQILTWGGPIAAFRWDFAGDVDFKDLSVREITAENGTVDGIKYFTGTSSSSNVQNLNNSTSDRIVDPANIPGDKLRKTFLNSHLANGSFTNTPTPNSNPTPPTAPEPGSNNGITGEPFDQQEVSSGDRVYMLWVQGDEDNTDVYLKISQDRGATFGDTINLSNNPASLSYNPQIVTFGENVYIVWEDDEGNSGNSDIFFIRSSDGGNTFTSKRNLSKDPSGSGSPQLSVLGDNVYVAWTGTSPDNTDIFLALSENNGNSFSEPENLSNDPDISFNPVISVNGTHIFVDWTNQDDNGLTNTKTVSLAQPRGEGYDITDAGVSYALNSTYTSSNGLADQNAQNSTYLQDNDNKTQIQNYTNNDTDTDMNNDTDTDRETGTETQGALNQTAKSSIPDSPPPPPYSATSNSSSNSSSSSNSDAAFVQTPETNLPKLHDQTTVINVDRNDLYATTIQNKSENKMNGGIDDKVKQTQLADQENIDANVLKAIADAKEALEARGTQKINEQTSVAENRIAEAPIQASQAIQDKEQKQLEQIADTEEHLPAADQQTETKSSLSGETEQKLTTQKRTETEVDGKEKLLEEKTQQQQSEQQREQEPELSKKDSHVDSASSISPSTSSEPKKQSSERERTEVNEKKGPSTPVQAEKIDEQQKIIKHKRIHDDAKEQRQRHDAKERVQNLIREANEALNNAEELVGQAKLAEQKAQSTIEEFNNQESETTEEEVEGNKQIIPQEINHLINEAKIADQIAQAAVEKYNDLRRAADIATKEFNTKYK